MSTEANSTEGQLQSSSVRLLRPSLVVLCGPAASGKSTFAERHFRPTQVISSDWARARVCDDERDQRFSAQAFSLVHFLVEQRLTLNRLCVVDSTALSPTSRKELLDLARRFQVPTVAIILDVPLASCIARDQKRERSVGAEVIERQYQAFDQAKTAIRQEGFDRVMQFAEGNMDNVTIEIVFRPVIRQAPKPEFSDNRRPERPGAPPLRRSNGNGVSAVPPRPYQPASASHPSHPGPAATTARPAAPPAPAAQPSATPEPGPAQAAKLGTDPKPA